MPLCVQCGLSTLGTAEICSHHSGHGDDWATANRIIERNEDLELPVSP